VALTLKGSPGESMASTIVKRSVLVRGHKTSVSLEEPFWNGLKEIAAARRLPLSAVLQKVDLGRNDNSNLSSAVRLFVLDHYRDQAEATKTESGNDMPAGFGRRDMTVYG
jgi:predicted DNA-binding ribbon-helix-helix protein